MVITPGLRTVNVDWHNETHPRAIIAIIIENPLYYRAVTCDANEGSRVIRSLTPAVTYTVMVIKMFQSNGQYLSSLLASQSVTLLPIGKMIKIGWSLFESCLNQGGYELLIIMLNYKNVISIS